MKNVNNKEVESEISDFSVFSRHRCLEVTTTELGCSLSRFSLCFYKCVCYVNILNVPLK